MVEEVKKRGLVFSLLLFIALTTSTATIFAQGGTSNLGAVPSGDNLTLEPVTVVGMGMRSGREAGEFPANLSLPGDKGAFGWSTANAVSDTLPDRVDISTRRDAGSQLIADLQAVEITDLTVTVGGLTIAMQEGVSLSQDPTIDDPYDNLNDGTTQYFNVVVPAGAARLAAETFDSTAADMDLYVGWGLVPSAATQVCAGTTTGTAVEYCNIPAPTDGDWWLLVQNVSASTAPSDTAALAYGVVAGDEGNMFVEGPTAVPAGTPFDLRVFWDEPAMAAGDHLYGQFSVGSDAANPGNIGAVDVNLVRHEDDVTKTVSADTAVPGDTLTYTITVQPNITTENLTYAVTDTIPAGLTYVPGSAVASGGAVNVTGDTLTWDGEMVVPGFTYTIATSQTDPACAAPLAGVDGTADAYLNLEAFNIFTNPLLFGNSVVFSADPGGGSFDLFGSDQGEIIYYTDDGFAFFDPSTPGVAPWVNESIPSPGEPNNLMAMLWRDLEIVYDQGLNRGVSLAALTSGGTHVALVIEYDDVEVWLPEGGGPTYDFEIVAYYDASPNRYEYIFAYNNMTATDGIGTIGLENASGSDGVQYGFNNLALTDGMAICFDLVEGSGSPVEISYQVTVDRAADGVLTNDAAHNTDNPGSQEAHSSAAVEVDGLPFIYISSNSFGSAGGVHYKDEDILLYDVATGDWSLYFDGSDMGLRATDVDAIHLMEDGNILMSFAQRLHVPGFGKVDDSDIVKFIPTTLGEDTAGTFEWFFDGSDVGLCKSGEDVDAFGFTGDGRLVVSTNASFTVPKTGGGHFLGTDDDLIVFNATAFGSDTQGDWEMYFDGSDVWDHTEDIWGTWLDSLTGDIYFALQNDFTAGAISGDALDIFICHPQSLGENTACTFEMFFDGSAAGFGGHNMDGFAVED